MANEAAKELLAALSDSFRSDLEQLQEVRRQRAALTSSATSAGGRVTVTVDADGIPTNIEFFSGIDNLTHREIAEAVLSAAREAALDVRQRSAAMTSPSRDDADLPKPADFLPGAPDLSALIPDQSPALLPLPKERTGPDDTTEPVFSDVVELPTGPDPGVRDTGWHGDPTADSGSELTDTWSAQELASDSEVTDRGW